MADYYGNPYEACQPECIINSDCSSNRACIRSKCQDPCPGTCGANAQCQVINHLSTCSCVTGFTGDPFRYCTPAPQSSEPTIRDPCSPSPCGPNSQCRVVNGQSVCSCFAEYIGSPPSCRPECTSSSDCSRDRACVNRKCANPCPNPCGKNTECAVINHNPICSCKNGFTGDPFTMCFPTPRE